MEEEPKNEKKPEFKGNLGFIWLVGILVILLGCTIVYTLKISKENGDLKQDFKSMQQQVQTQPLQPTAETTVTTQETTQTKNITTVENNTEVNNKKDSIIKLFKKLLSDNTWVKDNLYITENAFNNIVKSSEKQTLTFRVIQDKKTSYPAVVVKAELNDGIGVNLYLLTYYNENIKVESLTDGVCHPDHNVLLASNTNIAVEYAHMGSWRYSIYSIENGKAIKEKTGKGELKDSESDYIELESISGKYNLKEITTTLNKTNIEKYLNN